MLFFAITFTIAGLLLRRLLKRKHFLSLTCQRFDEHVRRELPGFNPWTGYNG